MEDHIAKVSEFREKALAWIPGERIRTVRYDPLMRSAGYGGIVVPEILNTLAPLTVVRVTSTEEISRLLALAIELQVPISVRQATGYLTPDIPRSEMPGSVVLDLDMKCISLRAEEGYVELGPSVTNDELNEYLAPYGYAFPVSVGPVTWGSLVGLNTSGQMVDAYQGKPGDYVLGLQVVLPNGEVIETGSRTLRKPSGPDLTRLFIGGQALFGVITLIRLRLVRPPRETVWGTASFDSLRGLGEAVSATYRMGAPLARVFDFMDDRYMHFTGAFEQIPTALVMVEMDGETPGSARWKLETALNVLKEAGAVSTEPLDQEQWQALTKVRTGNWTYLKRRGLLLLAGEVVDSPLSNLATLLEEARELQKSFVEKYPELQCFYWGHIGSLSFHPVFAAPVAWPYDRHREVAAEIRAQLLAIKIRHRASVGEQGLFPEHRDWFLQSYGILPYDLLSRIKAVFDPKELYNRGRL